MIRERKIAGGLGPKGPEQIRQSINRRRSQIKRKESISSS